MKKVYNIPAMRIKTFCKENVVTVSGDYSNPNHTVSTNLDTYIEGKGLNDVHQQEVFLTW